MKVNPHTGGGDCGGDDTTVQISLGEHCTTTDKLFPVGTTVHWTLEELLEKCSAVLYEPLKLHQPRPIQIQPTDKTKHYCIDEVEVVLQNENTLLKFIKETDDKWRQGDVSLKVPFSCYENPKSGKKSKWNCLS